MIAIPAAVPVNLNHQSAPGRANRRVALPPSTPKPSVAAARSWGDAIRSCRPAPDVSLMPTQRTLVAALQSTVSDMGFGRARPTMHGTARPGGTRPNMTEALPAQQRASPQVCVDAQWKLDDAQDVSETRATAPPNRRRQIKPWSKLHALEAVPGAGVIGQGREKSPMLSTDANGDVDSGSAAPMNPDAVVRQLVERREQNEQRKENEATRPISPQSPRTGARDATSNLGHGVRRSPKAETFRGLIDLAGTQHPRSATSAGLAELRRSTVRHIDDILHHPSRTPRKPDTRGLIPDEQSRASVVSSAQRLAAVRLRREGVYVTGVVQSSVLCSGENPRTASTTRNSLPLATGSKAAVHQQSQLAARRPQQWERGAIGPFEDGALDNPFFYLPLDYQLSYLFPL